jgi:hypothetical protein
MDIERVIKNLNDLADLMDKQQSQLAAEASEERGKEGDYAVDFKSGLSGGIRIARSMLLSEIEDIKRLHAMDSTLLIRPEGPSKGRIDGIEL